MKMFHVRWYIIMYNDKLYVCSLLVIGDDRLGMIREFYFTFSRVNVQFGKHKHLPNKSFKTHINIISIFF